MESVQVNDNYSMKFEIPLGIRCRMLLSGKNTLEFFFSFGCLALFYIDIPFCFGYTCTVICYTLNIRYYDTFQIPFYQENLSHFKHSTFCNNTFAHCNQIISTRELTVYGLGFYTFKLDSHVWNANKAVQLYTFHMNQNI